MAWVADAREAGEDSGGRRKGRITGLRWCVGGSDGPSGLIRCTGPEEFPGAAGWHNQIGGDWAGAYARREAHAMVLEGGSRAA